MIVPIVVRPWNLWGVTANKRAIPPVLMVRVNHLSVSLEMIKKKVTKMPFKGLDVRPSKVMNTFSYRNWTIRSWLIPFHISILSRSASCLDCLPGKERNGPPDEQKTANAIFPLNRSSKYLFYAYWTSWGKVEGTLCSIRTGIQRGNIKRISILEVFSIRYGSMRWTPIYHFQKIRC